MEKKEGKYLVNARVDIDYSKGKPKIKFGYPYKDPKKESMFQGGILYVTLFIWTIIGVIPFILFIQNYVMPDYIPYPEECGNFSLDNLDYRTEVKYYGDTKYEDWNRTYKIVYGFNVTCDNQTHIIDFNKEGGYFEGDSYLDNKWYFVKLILGMIWFYIALIPASWINKNLITRFLIKKKWYQKWLPKANAEGVLFKKRSKQYRIFKPKDLLENVLVIPSFSNVELDYKTTGDFSKYLQKIKIREHRNQSINIKSKKVKKEKMNKFKWYAIFYFKEQPKTGQMEVTYQ